MAVVVPVISTFDSRGIDRAIKDFKKLDSNSKKAGMALLSIDKGASSLLKSVGKVGAVVSGISGVIGSQLVSAAYESQKVMAQTGAIIKATGGAAGVSAKQVQEMTDRLSMQIGVDDELIQSTANILLTFKQVQNQVGANNDIFNQAVAASMDLANVFGSSEGAAKMLGKALSDPVKGVTALQRAGVNFTQQQRDQIKTLVASGRTLDAQKLILKEVESQVGGTAKATATGFDKMKVAVENVAEQMGTLLIPYVEQFSQYVIDNVVPTMQTFGDIVGEQGVGAGIEYLTGKIVGGIWNMGALGKTITVVTGAFVALRVASATFSAAMAAMNVITTISDGALKGLITRLGQAKLAMLAAGGITTILTIAAVAYGTYAKKKAEAADKTKEFVEALKMEGQAQLDALVALYKKDPEFKKAIDTLKKYGGTIEELKKYVDGGNGSLAAWSAAVDTVAGTVSRLDQVTQSANPNIDIQASLYETLRQKIPKLRTATQEQIDTFIAAVKMFQTLRKETVLTTEATDLFTKGLGVTTTTTDTTGGGVDTLEQKLAKLRQRFADWKREAEGVIGTQKSLKDATKDVSKANDDLAKATANVATAQAKLNQVVKGYGIGSAEANAAQAELTQAQRDQERSGYDLEKANFAVIAAQTELDDLRASGTATAAEIRQAEINLAEAKLSVKDAEDAVTASAKAVTDAQTKLNEVVNGATTESTAYKEALAELKTAQDDEVAALDRVNQAKTREFELTNKLTKATLLLAKAKSKLTKKQRKQAEQELADLMREPILSTTPPSQVPAAPTLPGLDLSNIDFSGIDFSGVSLGNIPVMGNGGMVMQPTLAMIGEAGPEAVVPLDQMPRGGDTYHIHINSKIADETLPDLLVAELRKFNRRSGAINIQVA